MIVDHRTYTLHPGKVKAFLEIYGRKGWPLQQQYLGDCIGWYVSTDIGPLNQVVHLWRYHDLNDRAARRARMQSDPLWAVFAEAAAPLIQHQENKILSAAPFYQP